MAHVVARVFSKGKYVLVGTGITVPGTVLFKKKIFCQNDTSQGSIEDIGIHLSSYLKAAALSIESMREKVDNTGLVRFGRAAFAVSYNFYVD